jgi:4'-phosphopantetheinyl transferase
MRRLTNCPSDWIVPPDLPAPRNDAVDVWRVVLPEIHPLLSRLWPILDPQEQQRAERFHFQHDREAFVLRHGVLRVLLGAYLAIAPAAVAMETAPLGKPRLRVQPPRQPLHFSLSRSGELALMAISAGGELGVDVERLRAEFDYRPIAKSFLPSDEAAMVRQLPAAEGRRRFFTLWTRMEACVKATGQGLGEAFHPEKAAAWCRPREISEPSGLTIVDLAPGEGYFAALAHFGQCRDCRLWHCDLPRIEAALASR